ncbi:MAG: hypothetical protein QOI13_2251, partial [Paraburkholderia sp.]|nr:hypothetical protein [Paraburkholderia sp.]
MSTVRCRRADARLPGQLIEGNREYAFDADVQCTRMAVRTIAKRARTAGRVIGNDAVALVIERRP